MGTAVFLICLIVTLYFYDVLIPVRILLSPARAFEFMSSFQHNSSRRVLSLARVWAGFRMRVEPFAGVFPRQCLVVSNHQSLADIPVLMQALPQLDLRFVAKRELRRRVPGVSATLREGRHALIGRKSGHREALRALRKLAALARQGVSPVVFPEGTRSRDGEVGSFHAAAFRTLAEASALPILSVAVEGGYAISNMKGLMRNIGRTRYRVRPLAVHPPVTSRETAQRTLEAVRTEIAAQIRQWRSPGRRPDSP